MEREIGLRLRLPQYNDSFSEDQALVLAELLSESQPPVLVAVLLLRKWYSKFHAASGPLVLEDAESHEAYLGDEIRREYAYFTDRALHGALTRRRQSVLLGHRSVRTWLDKYGPKRITFKPRAPGEPAAKRPCVSADRTLVRLSGAASIEDTLGERYRREVADLGQGIRLSVHPN